MRLMAEETVLIGHRLGMGIMTLEAGQKLAVLLVTLFTIEFGVLAGIIGQLGSFVTVAGDTYRLDIGNFRQIDIQGMMGVVAALAVFDTEVGLIRRIVAVGAGGDHICSAGRMLHVAVEAVDFGAVFRPVGCNIGNNFVMTFLTVVNGQRHLLCVNDCCQQYHQHAAGKQLNKSFHYFPPSKNDKWFDHT